MNKELIEQIVNEIISQQLLDNWRFYFLLLGLMLLSSVGAAFLSSYMKERGKNLATKADIKNLLNKLEETTTLTENIRAKVSDNFAYNSLRREKIEELFQLIYEYELWHPEQTQKILAGQPSKSVDALTSKIEMLISIYFSDSIGEVDALKRSDLLIVTFNLEMEAKKTKFDGFKYIECMQPVKDQCKVLRKHLIDQYQDELRL
ncbi:hypothetical protein P5E37_28155 [Vibrio parahaemolyticus]|nr:hypothetical protein [Vibrio parahaemolyticus]